MFGKAKDVLLVLVEKATPNDAGFALKVIAIGLFFIMIAVTYSLISRGSVSFLWGEPVPIAVENETTEGESEESSPKKGGDSQMLNDEPFSPPDIK